MKSCPYCNAPIDGAIGRQTVCPKCGKSLHTCKACRFYHPGDHYDCLEDIDEQVDDKSAQNFCDSFMISENHLFPDDGDYALRHDKDKAAFDALFKI
ncbi:MAG: hypothetical protein ACQGQO_01295 [Sphaerochaetaceae bacterium]